MNKETELYSWMLDGFISRMVDMAGQFNTEQWCWQPSAAVPSALMLATSVLEWMVCDRQHITEPDAKFHEPAGATPMEREQLVESLRAELKLWLGLMSQIRVEDLDAPRRQFNRMDADDQNVRWMMLHAISNAVQRFGEMTMLSLALGHAGSDQFVVHLPGQDYERLRPSLD